MEGGEGAAEAEGGLTLRSGGAEGGRKGRKGARAAAEASGGQFQQVILGWVHFIGLSLDLSLDGCTS